MLSFCLQEGFLEPPHYTTILLVRTWSQTHTQLNGERDAEKSRLLAGQNIKRDGRMNVRVTHSSPGHNSFNIFQSILMSKHT